MTTRDPDPDQWATVIPLPAGTEAPALAREFVRHHAAGLPAGLVANAVLIVSELVTNAVVHGQPEIRLRVRGTPPGIGLGVQDDGAATPHLPPADADPTQPGGRGLRIVDTLSSAWGIAATPPGKIVWFELRETP